jgi:hypothetical protein
VNDRSPNALSIAMSLCALACGEPYEGLSARQLATGLSAAGRVRPEVVSQTVNAIFEARRADAESDFALRELCPRAGCSYSRAATADIIRQVWSQLPGGAQQQHVQSEGLSTTNLFVDIVAAGSSEWVIAVAHYDAWFGAANDNATGVAVTLEAGVALASEPLDRNVRLLLTDGEERGMVGAERYISEFGVDGVTLVLNADMIAHVGDTSGWLTGEEESAEYIVQANEGAAEAAFQMAELARSLPEPLHLKPVVYPGIGVSAAGFAIGYALSDHAPFWLRGVDALFPFPAGDKPDWYHTPRDTPEQVNAGRLRRFSRLWAAAIAAFATEEQ